MQINIHEAKTHFSRLIEKALAGEEVIIARNGTPILTLKPIPAQENVLRRSKNDLDVKQRRKSRYSEEFI